MNTTATTARAVRGRARRAVGGLLVVACAVALVGCSVRQDEEPRVISQEALPRALREASSTTSTTTRTAQSQQRTIYLVQNVDGTESLVPISQTIIDPGEPNQSIRATLDRLLGYQKPEDSPYSSAIPTGTRVLRAGRDGDVLNLDLSNFASTIESSAQKTVFAQLVFTATAEANTGDMPISGVRFSIDGQPVAVQIDNRTAEPGSVVTREDFASLKPALPALPGETTTPDTEPPPVSAVPN